MKTIIFLPAYIFFLMSKCLYSQFTVSGDTVIVQTINYSTPCDTTQAIPGEPRVGTFLFPGDTVSFRKILVYYTLKCDPAQNPQCGEWDTHTFIRVYDDNGVRYEIGRYITPYGYGINTQMTGGFTWVFDVTDYEPLLHDSVYLEAGNRDELLDMKFIMINGTPPRNVNRIINLWTGDSTQFNTPLFYNANAENILQPITVNLLQNEVNARVKMRTTGHGFGGNLNCSEFCPRTHTLHIDGVQQFSEYVWRNDCGLNPLYPQGGTWIYDRANWCPGAEVKTTDFEITPFISPGAPVTIDYNLEPGYVWNGQGNEPYYTIESQLITYGEINFNLDASVEEIKAPSNQKYYQRMNPTCSNPVITIRNNGANPLTSVTIMYGVEGGSICSFNWTGNLGFSESENVTLPTFDWSGLNVNNPVFYSYTSLPNGQSDNYPVNDTMQSNFELPRKYKTNIVFWFKTNNFPNENQWFLFNDAGDTLYSKTSFSANTLYKDTLLLDTGCYTLVVTDNDNDGISWWANSDGTGYAKLYEYKDNWSINYIKTFNPDFGTEIRYHFTLGAPLDSLPSPAICSPVSIVKYVSLSGEMIIYPNPASQYITLSMQKSEIIQTIEIFNVLGVKIREISNSMSPCFIKISELNPGIYIMQIIFNNSITILKFVKL